MVALNLLAASLLVAGVGASLGLPSPRNVDVLPAIGYVNVTSGTDALMSFVSPLADGADYDMFGGGDYQAGVVDFVFAGETLRLTADTEVDYFSLSYHDGALYGSVDSGSLSTGLYVFSHFGVETAPDSITVTLPDLSYWDFDVGQWSLSVLLRLDADDFKFFGSYYGYYDGDTFSGVAPAELGADVNPITAITDGLTAIAPLGGALTNGFDAVFMDDGALTAVGMFAFILMGVGISLSITKKCFNWVTGRHGM